MVRQFKIVVEKHPDGYVAYPLGLKGVVIGEGDTYFVRCCFPGKRRPYSSQATKEKFYGYTCKDNESI
jgi:hypothetical protein